MLHYVDYTIIGLYVLIILGVGIYFSKRAAGSIDEYFLGGRHIPWYILGLSGMATFVDMSGTAMQTSFYYMFGVKGYWFCYRAALALILSFLMIFMGKWLNRARVMTNAELIELRFGGEKQGQTARLLTACSILLLGMFGSAYFFVGGGNFLSAYFPFSAQTCGIIYFALVLIYLSLSGFYGVVYTDIFQAVLILGMIFFIVIKAMVIGTPDYFAQYASEGWTDFLPSWNLDVPAGYENMKSLGLLVLFWIMLNAFQGFAMPWSSAESQRFYAAKDERESSLVGFQWIVLTSLKYLLMMGLGILSIGIASQIASPEGALTAIINHYLPVGIKGMFIAALLAAAMSTLDSIINSTAAYFVKDIYQQHICPRAGRKHLLIVSYITTAGILIGGIILGWDVGKINDINIWICMGLITGMLPPNILKWIWWRFNGMGYASGMIAGLLSSLVVINIKAFEGYPEYVIFIVVTVCSTVGSIAGVFLGKPPSMDVLIDFYKKIKPFGFWGPVKKHCDVDFLEAIKKENRRDLLLLGPACLWQMSLFAMLTAIVAKKWGVFIVTFTIVAMISVILYKYWYKNLKSKKTA